MLRRRRPPQPTARTATAGAARRVLLLSLGLWALAPGAAMAGQSTTSTSTSTAPATTPATTTPASETSAPLTPTRLVGRPPGTIVNGTSPVTIELSGPPAPGSPTPMLSPSVAGKWTTAGDTESFTAASTLQPCSTYELTVWADTTASGHSRLGRRQVLKLRVACPPLAGMQQALARLGYLGAVFRPTYRFVQRSGAETRREAAVNAYHPPRGMLAADPSTAPPVRMGSLDATTRGALMVYQSDNNLPVTGEPDVSTWDSILYAETHYRRDPHPYTWVTVSESLPETLVLYEGRHRVLSTLVNTGVAGAETELGIFPIYSRFVSTTMTGTDPDGTHYVAPDVPWVNYFNGGDAVHGYPRASYGYPQSNGCVELPIETAHTVFDKLAIGDIVEVR